MKKVSKNNGERHAVRQDMSQIVNGEYTHNRGGEKVCAAFQTGACGPTVGNAMCPNDRTSRHQCSLCLGTNHDKPHCHSKTPPNKKIFGKGGKGGKGKSKGKGKW